MLAKTSASLNELLSPSCRKASEHTAAAALTELRNTSSNHHHHHHHQHHQQQQQHHNQKQQQQKNQSSLVTSILSKNHINHLEANSVSVIPIEAKTSTIANNIQTRSNTNQLNQQKPPIIQMKSLSQLQQQLETAAVLMDISKKVIISPPSSNPQSPSVLDQSQPQSITSTVINLKRSSSLEEMDLSVKRQKVSVDEQQSSPRDARKNYHQSADLSVIKRRVKEELPDELSQPSDSNDSSDPGRLQMDINSQDSDDSKFNHKQIVDSGRETPDSLKSEDHGTDPATTQLWQALARTTGNFERLNSFQQSNDFLIFEKRTCAANMQKF